MPAVHGKIDTVFDDVRQAVRRKVLCAIHLPGEAVRRGGVTWLRSRIGRPHDTNEDG